MARGRVLFFRRVGSILKQYWQWVALALLAMLLAVGIPRMAIAYAPQSASVLSQSSTSGQPIEAWRSLYQQGNYEAALEAIEPVANDPQAGNLARALAANYLSLTYQKLGEWEAAREAIEASIAQVETLGAATENLQRASAAIFNTRGQLQLALGEAENAYQSWEAATEIYRQLEDEAGITGSLINQARALETLGFHRRSCATILPLASSKVNTCEALAEILEENGSLLELLDRVDRQENSMGGAIVLQALGNALRSTGELQASRDAIQTAWELASNIDNDDIKSSILLDLGNTERDILWRQQNLALSDFESAIDNYRDAIALATTPQLKLQAQLNLLGLFVRAEGNNNAIDPQVLAATILSRLDALPPSQTAIAMRINLACSAIRCDRIEQNKSSELSLLTLSEIETLLQEAQQQAEQFGDDRSLAYILGTWGKLYELSRTTLDEAKNYTQQAIELSRTIDAPDLTYQWEWQLGRILSKSNRDLETVISAYEIAIEDLTVLRRDLTNVNLGVRLSFREQIEPVYRQFFDILLEPESPSSENLDRARFAIADFQLAELESFLDCNLQDNTPDSLDNIAREQQAAILYPIILSQQVAVIAKFPESPDPVVYKTNIPEEEVLVKLTTLRQQFEEDSILPESIPLSQEVYRWLVSPIENELDFREIKTLVFVPETRFRNVPVSALRYADCQDGKCYLIEKYAVVMNLGTNLTNPQPLGDRNLTTLMGGLTKALPDRGFLTPLDSVERQLDWIEDILETTRDLRDRGFTSDNLKFLLDLEPFSIVHLATHGEFSSEPENTRIEAWDDSLFLNDLEALFQTQSRNQFDPIELLVLSACRTGVEDIRATLGLAGVAIQSGARSTLASLWYLNEESTAILMASFYENLTQNPDPFNPDPFNKAQALQQAQLNMISGEIKNQVPRHWAPYVLVGNWL